MKASIEFIEQLEKLFELYEKEVNDKKNKGVLREKTVKTYLHHADGAKMTLLQERIILKNSERNIKRCY